jgi:hypothetical protein
MSYASDGFCHNAEPGTYGHECCKPAVWVGTKANGFSSGFCGACRASGYEAREMVSWVPVEAPAGYVAEYRNGDTVLPYGYGATHDAALIDGRKQVSGLDYPMQSIMRRRIYARALGADEASEVLEMLATPWGGV